MAETSKKLSLEERLSLASKKTKKKNKKSFPSSPILGQETYEKPERKESEKKNNETQDKRTLSSSSNFDRQAVFSSESSGATEVSMSNDDDPQEEKSLKAQIKILNSLRNKEPWSHLLDKSAEFSTIEGFIENLEPILQSLYRNLQSYKTVDGSSKEDDNVKDDLIRQLRYEGEKLAEKELRQSMTIKTLRKRIEEMNNDIGVTQEELAKSISNYERMFNSHEDLQVQLNNSEVTIKNLRQDNNRLKDLESQSEERKKEAEDLRHDLHKSNEQFKKRENDLLVEINNMKVSFQEQVTQLETTLEKLRIELDNKSKKNGDKSVPITKGTEEALKEELKSLKVNSSQLENSLISRISDLEIDSNRLKQSNRSLEEQVISFKGQNESLQNKLIKESREKEENSVNLKKLHQGYERLQKTLKDSLEDYSLLQKKYDIRQAQLESSSVPMKKDRKPSQVADAPTTEDNKRPPSVTDNWLYPPNMSRMSSMGTQLDFDNSSIHKEVDEISDRPVIDDDDELSINEEVGIPDEAAVLDPSIQDKNSASRLTNSVNHHKHTVHADSAGQVNAHMISKLGAEIRRYEVESASLQNNCERLQREKTEASNEILRLLEENEKVHTLSKEKDDLVTKVEMTQRELDSSLQSLGCKTKKIEELENDVADLKEVMQQQIQQMADMQERLR